MVKLGDIAKIQPKSKLKAGEGLNFGKYKFFNSSNIQTKFFNEYYYTQEALILGTGGNPSVHYCNTPFATSTDCFVLYFQNNIQPKLIYYYLTNNLHILENGFKGASIKHISKDYILNIQIPLPPIEEQRHIANVLDKVTAQIDNCNKILQNLDLLVKSKFVQMFGDPVSNPLQWEKNKLSNECEIITGNTPSRKIKEYYGNYIEWIKSDNINTSLSFLTTATEYLSQKGLKVARYVEKGSILMTCIAGSINCIGNVAITDRTVSFNQQINAIVPNKNNSWFMYYQFILSKKYIQSCINMSLKGILTKNQLSNLEFIFPPIELQNQFAEFVENVEKQKTTTQNTLNQLETLKNALMQEYFS